MLDSVLSPALSDSNFKESQECPPFACPPLLGIPYALVLPLSHHCGRKIIENAVTCPAVSALKTAVRCGVERNGSRIRALIGPEGSNGDVSGSSRTLTWELKQVSGTSLYSCRLACQVPLCMEFFRPEHWSG